MATKTMKEKAPVEPPITPSEAHEEPLTEVKVAAAAGEAESSESEPLTEVKVVPLTEVKEKADEAAGKAGSGNSEPPTEAKEEASEETPTALVYDYEVLPPSRAGATEEQIAMAGRAPGPDRAAARERGSAGSRGSRLCWFAPSASETRTGGRPP